MRCIVQCLSEFKISTGELSRLLVRVASMIFKQRWKVLDEESKEEGNEVNKSSEDDVSESEDTVGFSTKQRQVNVDLKYVLPSR